MATLNSSKGPFAAPQLWDGALQNNALAFWKTALTAPSLAYVEALRFGSRRLQAQADFLTDLMSCKDMAQACEKQTTFVRDAMAEYGREAGTIAHTMREAAEDQPRAA
jgi:hypothetical protein